MAAQTISCVDNPARLTSHVAENTRRHQTARSEFYASGPKTWQSPRNLFQAQNPLQPTPLAR